MKPETLKLKRLLADLGIPRSESTVSTRASLGPSGVCLTDAARKTAVDRVGDIVAAGYAVLVSTYRCGCPFRVWVCASSSPEVRRIVRADTHDCPTGAELLPVTPIDWLRPITAKD